MNVSLTPELEKLISEKVASGMYHSASEVVREGLRLLAEQDEIRARRIEMLQQQIQVGLDQLDRGEVRSGEEVIEALRQRSRELRSRKQ